MEIIHFPDVDGKSVYVNAAHVIKFEEQIEDGDDYGLLITLTTGTIKIRSTPDVFLKQIGKLGKPKWETWFE